MIVTFADKRTELIFNEVASKGVPVDILKRALAKLQMINISQKVEDLRIPPGNRLELLSGDRAGQYSIRVNDQWPICFHWTETNDAMNVELVDYH